MSAAEILKVTSHVGRDLLAAAASFKTEAAAIWEYVVNSLQYIDEGVLPKVQVIVKPRHKIIEIRDNGRGMTAEGLTQYFTMHGENIDRLRGRAGRGKFGTGKAAAFGIGKSLHVDTRRNGVRNVVELHRNVIEASSGKDIDLRWIVRNQPTEFPNGTTVTIDEIFLPKLSTFPIIEYIERHLQIYRARMPEVAVNEHVCQYREPIVAEVHTSAQTRRRRRLLAMSNLPSRFRQLPCPPWSKASPLRRGLATWLPLRLVALRQRNLATTCSAISTSLCSKAPRAPFNLTTPLDPCR